MDKIGRKPLMLVAIFGCCLCLIIEAAMVAVFTKTGTNKVGLSFGVVALYLLVALNGLGVDSCGVVWYSEIFPNHIRAKGLSLCVTTIALTNLVYLQVSVTAFKTIGKCRKQSRQAFCQLTCHRLEILYRFYLHYLRWRHNLLLCAP